MNEVARAPRAHPGDRSQFCVSFENGASTWYVCSASVYTVSALPLGPELLRAGRVHLNHCEPLVAAADPSGTVSPRSRVLCAALAALGLEAYRALGGRLHATDVGTAAVMLSLLTKIDDQVIDSAAFHGGMITETEVVADRVRTRLAPTLASVRTGTPATQETRCLLAAALGQRLEALSGDPSRLRHLVSVIALGWEIQARGVSILSRHPGKVPRQQVSRATRDISGAWLLMITLVGTLPADAARSLQAAEEEAFFAWGQFIQQADALADLDKDTQDGLVCSVPGHYAYQNNPETFLAAVARRDSGALYALYANSGADLACLPALEQRRSLLAPLADLGQVGPILEWIHGFLLWRYLQHPACQRSASHQQVRPLLHDPHGWTKFILESTREERSCSEH